MKKEKRAQLIRSILIRNLGSKLAVKMGKTRLLDFARDIADYKEQVDWPNTPSELRRLTDKIRCLPAAFAMRLYSIRLSKQAEPLVHGALWATLKKTFPALDMRPR